MSQIPLPQELEKIRESARRAILPITPTSAASHAARDILLTAKRTDASRDLPPYYLVYFLLVDLLGFQSLGRFEKLDWSIPVDLDGVVYLIEYRKSGLGVFAGATANSEQQARRIVALLKKAIRAATPFFKWVADRAVRDSRINVRNVARPLFERYLYFRDRFVEKSIETQARKQELEIDHYQGELDIAAYSVKARKQRSPSELVAMFTFPWARLAQDSNWLALAAVDAFFAWTEHIFIHLAILQGRVVTGEEVAQLAESDWGTKFKRALDIRDTIFKGYFDELIVVRRQLRNFVAHTSIVNWPSSMSASWDAMTVVQMQVGTFQKIMDARDYAAQIHEINGGYGQIDWVSFSAMSKSKGVRARIDCVIFSDQPFDGIKSGFIRRLR